MGNDQHPLPRVRGLLQLGPQPRHLRDPNAAIPWRHLRLSLAQRVGGQKSPRLPPELAGLFLP